MNQIWIIYTVITVAYIVILILYFLRRSKSHETELTHFLSSAKDQLSLHQQIASRQANLKVLKAAHIVKKVQEATEAFEQQAQSEYDQIISQAQEQKRQIIASTKTEIEELFQQAETELQEYRLSREREIERNLVKLVMSVAERVTELSLDRPTQLKLIQQALQEIKQNKNRSA